MQRISKIVSFFFFLSCVSTACGPAKAPVTSTAVPINTFLPTSSSIPEPSATATLSPVEKAFMIPTRQDSYVNTPTPIATPELASLEVKLKTLSEQDFLDLIIEMNQYSYQNYPALYGDWWTASGFVGSQETVGLAIQEYLYRFPESPYGDRLRWQLAFINSIAYKALPGNEYDDKWLVTKLQQALDQGTTSPDQLETVLDKLWFDVAYVQPIENLFADGKTGILYVIAPQIWAEEEDDPKSPDYFRYGGLFIIVREIRVGEFQVIPLKSAWKFSFSDSFIHEVSDHNQNGVPEIALYIGAHSGTMCGGNLLIYEWNQDAFVELTKNDIYLRDCGEDFEYSLVNSFPAISYHGFMPRRTEQYVWDGDYYEFAGYEIGNLVEKWRFAESLPEEAGAIEAILSSRDQEGLSPSLIDFLRFRLGIVYALISDSIQVKRVLQDLVEHPTDETRTIYSDFAKNFLRYYSGDKSLFLSCRKSREFFDTVADSSEDEEDLFGIPFDFVFGPGLLRCFDRDVFEPLITKMPVTVENVPAELRNNGMNLYYAEKRDVNVDGIAEEWLVVFDDGIYVIFSDGSYYRTVQIKYFWYGEDATQYSNARINIERWMGIQDPVMTVITDQELSILAITEEYTTTELSYGFDMDNIFFSSQDNPPGYQVVSIKPQVDEEFYGVPWSGYRWDSNHQEFRDDLLEYRLFVTGDPNKASAIADMLMPILMDWKDLETVAYWLPRYFYLCGLSYELSGDSQKAAEIYWQIWHDFPDSYYALMTRYKLESVNP